MTIDKEPKADASALSESEDNLHYTKRGDILGEEVFQDGQIDGYDAERMRARAALTSEEEKKLMRRVDWRVMPLCAMMFLLKNIDYQNVCVKSTPHPSKRKTDETFKPLSRSDLILTITRSRTSRS